MRLVTSHRVTGSRLTSSQPPHNTFDVENAEKIPLSLLCVRCFSASTTRNFTCWAMYAAQMALIGGDFTHYVKSFV